MSNVGDSVSAGQQLASLDTESLVKTLHDDQATLAQAKLTLAKALNGESVSSGRRCGSSQPQATTSAAAVDRAPRVVLTAATSGSTNPQIAAAQAAVLKAQTTCRSGNHCRRRRRVQVRRRCRVRLPESTARDVDGGVRRGRSWCVQDRAGQVQAAQAEVTAAQKELSACFEPTRWSSRPAGGEHTGRGDRNEHRRRPAARRLGSSQGSAPSSQGSSPSSADLVKYQKQVDAAEADVTVAEQAVAQAAIVSPIAGQVVAVNIAVGDEISSAASSTQNIVVKGSGGYEATTSISVDRISDVAVGQPATVLADGRSAPIEGKVVAISEAPDSTSSSSTTTYRVTVALDHPEDDLRNGGTATIAIITKQATSALAVPTSAVSASGTRRTVTVLDGSTTTQVQVGVGVVGDTWTEITSGLPGQTVVLATVTKPLPDSATSGSNTNGGATFFGGGGGGPGGGGAPELRRPLSRHQRSNERDVAMKKVLTTLGTLGAVAVLVAGCGGGGSDRRAQAHRRPTRRTRRPAVPAARSSRSTPSASPSTASISPTAATATAGSRTAVRVARRRASRLRTAAACPRGSSHRTAAACLRARHPRTAEASPTARRPRAAVGSAAGSRVSTRTIRR